LENTDSSVADWQMVAHSSNYFSFNEVGLSGRFYINNGGDCGITVVPTTYRFEVNGGSSGGDILCFDLYTHDGGVHTSDARLKENIVPATLGLNFIDTLNPVSYK
jgi:hypothetical protein